MNYENLSIESIIILEDKERYSLYQCILLYIIIITIIIIKNCGQCKVWREQLTLFPSSDPSPQYQPMERKEKNGKHEKTKIEREV